MGVPFACDAAFRVWGEVAGMDSEMLEFGFLLGDDQWGAKGPFWLQSRSSLGEFSFPSFIFAGGGCFGEFEWEGSGGGHVRGILFRAGGCGCFSFVVCR